MIDYGWERWLRTGDAAALDGLLAAELPRLIRQARRRCGQEAEDAVQDGVLSLLCHRTALPIGIGFHAATVTVVKSAARMNLRKNRRRLRRFVPLADDVVQTEERASDGDAGGLLAALSESEKGLLASAVAYPDASHAAGSCGISVNAWRVRLHRLRQRLRRLQFQPL